VLPFSKSVALVVAVLAFVRLIACLALAAISFRLNPGLLSKITVRLHVARSLVHFGGWMTVTNIVSPLMVSLDRLLLGSLISMSAVAYYATPSEIVNRLFVLPTAIVGVLFPAFASGFVQDKAKTGLLYARGVKYVLLSLFPPLLLMVVFARPGLTLWLGSDFAVHSARVLQWLALGVLLNSLAQVPFALIQGAGRPDITGKLHLAELPAYAAILYPMIRLYGIEGAAMAWTLRAAVDMLALFVLSHWILKDSLVDLYKVAVGASTAIAVLIVAWVPMQTRSALMFAVSVIIAFMSGAWVLLLDPTEKLFARSIVRLHVASTPSAVS
jgi:O-antigen/teichoic acid export membrane protein